MSATPEQPLPPVARRGEHVRTFHGDSVADPYAWLSDSADPEVIAHLEAENAYAEAVTAELAPLRAEIVAEIGARTQQTDLSVPVYYRGWWYFTRTKEGLQYGISCRVADSGQGRPRIAEEVLPGEQVLVDGNVEAGGGEFFSLGASSVSSNGESVAFAVDLEGDERFDLRIREIATGRIVDDSVTRIGYGVVWSVDDRHVFYTRADDAWRACQVWRHEIGADPASDVLVFEEPDERFWVSIGESTDDRYLVVSASSKTTSEVHLLDLASPEGGLRCVSPRREGLEYDVEPAGDVMFIIHNRDRADFDVAWAPIDATDSGEWVRWLDPVDGERLVGVGAFARDVVIAVRSEGFSELRLARRLGVAGAAGFAGVDSHDAATPPAGQESWLPGAWRDEPWQVPTPEAVHTIGLSANPDAEAPSLLLSYESLITPRTVLELDLATRERTVLRTQPVLGGFDPADYVTEALTARAADGTLVPISLVAHKSVPRDGTAPGVLYAYGAYEVCLDPWFSIPRLSVLDRGVVWAVAHARGGGELGRSWYEQGRLEYKPTTFTDVVACADHLVESGWVAPDRLALEGGSAGGLMVGAVLNLRPDRFAVAHADVPFVDALTTILDPTMPLTVTEWEEWGDPLHNADVYALMKSYTPYENIRAERYPAILATTSLNDTRVSYAEPAKWVARLRETVTGDLPVLLRTEMIAGHGGRSGRYDAWAQYAWEEGFVLARLGATERVTGPLLTSA
ncbi:MAG: S9 family peptidase [Dermatophilus congolensis]|nr:S9 family peptidase [Dermatophilus congolensis]